MRLVRVGEAAAFGIALDGGAVYFLQEHHVGSGFGNTVTHGFQHEATIAGAIALVNVVSQNVDLAAHETPFLSCSINAR